MWLPAFEDIVELASVRLDAGDGLRVDDPQHGRVEGIDAFRVYQETSREWLAERDARPKRIATTVTPSRSVGEYEVQLTQHGRTFTLPVGVMADTAGPRSCRAVDPRVPQPLAAAWTTRPSSAVARA